VGRAEPRAGSVGDAAVERDPDDGDVGVRHLVETREPSERRRPGEAGHHGGVDRTDRSVRRAAARELERHDEVGNCSSTRPVGSGHREVTTLPRV